jgi:hypothetical protein
MLGATLAAVLNLVKNELRASLSAGSADDAAIKQAIETKQEWLSSMFDWAELEDEWDATVVGRYTTFPTVDVSAATYSINFDRPLSLYVKDNDIWEKLQNGICIEDYNTYDSDLSETMDPPQKWRFKPGNRASFEIWPIPTTSTPVRFTGQRKLATLRTGGTLDTTKTLDLDDMLVALAVAVDLLAGKDAQTAKASLFETRFTAVRSANKTSDERFFMGGGNMNMSRQMIRRTKLVVVP